MQLAWSRIWTRVAVSISYDDNHYTTGTSGYCTIMAKLKLKNSKFSNETTLHIHLCSF